MGTIYKEYSNKLKDIHKGDKLKSKRSLIRTTAIFMVLVIATVMIVSPVTAAPPVYEDWQYFSAANGQVAVTMNINTTNLKANEFSVVNNSDDWAYFAIVDTTTGSWVVDQEAIVAPNQTYILSVSLNFRRLPATDPDDPNSIRMPNDTVFWLQYPTDYR